MHASAYFSGFTTAPPKPTLPFPTPTTGYCYCYCYYSPFNGSRPGSGPARLSVKASASDGGGFYAMAAKMSFYELLGVAETGTEAEVKLAYKKLARKYHPDVSPPGRVEEYTSKFIMVKEAYETLSDPVKRALYDREMAMGDFHSVFSPRRHYHHDIDQVKKRRNEWKTRWESQLSELMRRSNCKEHGGGDVSGNVSWAARVRNQKDEFVSK